MASVMTPDSLNHHELTTMQTPITSDMNVPGHSSPSQNLSSQNLPVSSQQPNPLGLWQRLSGLPISQKTQLMTLLMVVSLGGVIGLGSKALVNSLHTQLRHQTQSQLAVTELNYASNLDNIGLGFATQAENPTLVNATLDYANGKPLSPEVRRRLQSILHNEFSLRKLEYATLVGKDRRIIVNANIDRTGQVFDPNQLVSRVFKDPQQIRTSEIVPWLELTLEKPPLPDSLTKQDSLIRYTITPIKAPGSQTVIGALISGDLVNGNLPIVQKTVDAFQGVGYSAVYLHQPSTGDFTLATAFAKTELRQPSVDLPLTDQSLLRQAVNAKGQSVSGRSLIGDRTYTLSAKALPNSNGDTVAVLVYGDPELGLQKVLRDSVGVQLGLLGVVVIIVLGAAWAIAQTLLKPIRRLQEATEAFAQGNYDIRLKETQNDELGRLAHTFNQMADSIAANDRQVRQETDWFRFLSQLKIPQAFDETSLKQWFQGTLTQARQLLEADRLLIYHLAPDGSGTIIYESVAMGFGSSLAQLIADPCIPAEVLNAYSRDRVWVMDDLKNKTLDPQHRQLLEKLEVKANLIVPILNQGQLFGLLIAHQCSTVRQWEEQEINFLKQLAVQLQVTLDQVSLNRQQTLESSLNQYLKKITQQITNTFNAESLFDLVVRDSREALSTDRVIIYCFDEDWKGTIITESVNSLYPQALGAQIADPCFAQNYVEQYRQGRVKATANIQKAGLTDCHLQQLEPFKVKANLVAPIIVAEKLYGLLIAHHCEAPRYWHQTEIDFFTQVALQVGVALERANLLKDQIVATEQLQQQALDLLRQVEPISHGDLTIRAQVTDNEIGTLADVYNTTVDNLSHLVTQVQQASRQVSTTTDYNAHHLDSLGKEALRQIDEIAQATRRLNIMGESIKAVADHADQTLLAFAQANQKVEAGEIAINQTVDGMATIRQTVTETVEKVHNLSAASQQIGQAVSLISRFAAQTHLLALKASIEAARAGEEGRGFAVIADEVRTLAAQSAEATAEIEALVINIQSETQQVTKVMTRGTEQVVQGSHLVENTRQSLTEIAQMSQHIEQLVKSISVATLNQSEASETVTQVMEEVSAIAHHTSASVADVSDSFKQLLTVAGQLQTSVEQFKVTSSPTD